MVEGEGPADLGWADGVCGWMREGRTSSGALGMTTVRFDCMESVKLGVIGPFGRIPPGLTEQRQSNPAWDAGDDLFRFDCMETVELEVIGPFWTDSTGFD